MNLLKNITIKHSTQKYLFNFLSFKQPNYVWISPVKNKYPHNFFIGKNEYVNLPYYYRLCYNSR